MMSKAINYISGSSVLLIPGVDGKGNRIGEILKKKV